MSTFGLKLIAIISMTIDHVGAIFFPDIIVFRIIGRLAFPIFAFLLVEGFINTKNVFKYASRLLIFAFISEIPFDIAFKDKILEFSHQNVMFTLFIGLVVIYLCEKYKKWFHRITVGIIGMGIAYFLKVDYTFVGIFMIFAFYLLRKQKLQNIIAQGLINLVVVGGTQMYGVLSMIPISFYNGKTGRFKFKLFFYIFYPAHLLLLYYIKKQLKGE